MLFEDYGSLDFSQYEGKEIIIVYNNEIQSQYQNIVVGCEYDIGITIVKRFDKKFISLCIPFSETKYYNENFFMFINAFENGILYMEDLFKIDTKYDKPYSILEAEDMQEKCPFN